jgi:ornithine carbamoyltransferase
MGRESESDARVRALRHYALNAEVVDMAAPDAIVMHCLPAHRGEEISASVIDGDRSVVWDQAENRLHAQKALLAWLLA